MCMIDDVGDDSIFYREAWHAARMPYTCCECGRAIAAGERYRYVATMWDISYSVETYRTCGHCAAAEDWLRVECNGWLFGAVEEDLAGHVEYGPWSDDESRHPIRLSRPARLVVGMRRRWQRFDGTGLMAIP